MVDEKQDRIFGAIEALNASTASFVEMFPALAKQVGDLQASVNRIQADVQLVQAKLHSIEPDGKESVATRIHQLEIWQKSEIENHREMKSWKMGVILALMAAAASVIAALIK